MSPNKELIEFLQKQGDSMLPRGSISHWEALAQTVWKKALGYDVVDNEGKVVEYVPPDKASIDKLFDHMVGKPKAAPPPKKSDKKAEAVPLHKRVGSALTGHVKQKEDKDADARGKDQTRSEGSLSKRVRDMAMRRNRNRSPEGPDQESGVQTGST